MTPHPLADAVRAYLDHLEAPMLPGWTDRLELVESNLRTALAANDAAQGEGEEVRLKVFPAGIGAGYVAFSEGLMGADRDGAICYLTARLPRRAEVPEVEGSCEEA